MGVDKVKHMEGMAGLLARIAFFFILAGCSTTSDSFLIENLTDEDKSKALTQKGIEQFNQEIEAKENYLSLPRVKAYFENAISFDPLNKVAKDYLARLTGYADEVAKEKIAAATKYLQKQRRTETENYNLCYVVQKAYEVAPQNKQVIELRKSIETILAGFVKKYIDTASSILKQVNDKDPTDKKEKMFLDIFDNYTRVLKIKPDDQVAQAGIADVKTEISSVVESRSSAAKVAILKRLFVKAETEVKALSILNLRIGNVYDGIVKNISYDLYLAWAEQDVKSRNYDLAAVRIDRALSSKRTREALDLKAKIDSGRNQLIIASSFDKWISEIDKNIGNKDYLAAYWKIKDLVTKVTSPSYIDIVKIRENRVKAALPDMYESAVGLYNEEKFAQAVVFFEVLADADKNDAEVREYLDRARAKQKVLDSF